jgi:hypothetical protein
LQEVDKDADAKESMDKMKNDGGDTADRATEAAKKAANAYKDASASMDEKAQSVRKQTKRNSCECSLCPG